MTKFQNMPDQKVNDPGASPRGVPKGKDPSFARKALEHSNLDYRVNVKVKLALFWIALMFLYIYNDILSLYQPGHVAELTEGHSQGMYFTQPILFGAAVLMALPGLMVLLSATLKVQSNRWANSIAGIFHILVLIGTQFIGEGDTWLYWRFYELLELILLLLIIRLAWRWPTNRILMMSK